MRSLIAALLLLPLCASATEDEMWEEARRDAVAFERRTGVAMEWLKGDPAQVQQVSDAIRAWAPIALDLDASLDALIAELSVYPDGFLRASGLKKIVLARGLERGGKSWGGFAFWGGPNKGTLYVGLRNIRRAAVTIHHEVFHLAQHVKAVLAREGDWRACNPKGFVYEAEGPVDRSAPRQATLTEYARTSLVEDQAEVFAWLVADAAFVDRQAEQDTGVACKARLTREFAREVDSAFNDARWQRLRTRQAGEPY